MRYSKSAQGLAEHSCPARCSLLRMALDSELGCCASQLRGMWRVRVQLLRYCGMGSVRDRIDRCQKLAPDWVKLFQYKASTKLLPALFEIWCHFRTEFDRVTEWQTSAMVKLDFPRLRTGRCSARKSTGCWRDRKSMFRTRSLVWGTVYVGSHDIIEYEILLLFCRPQQLEAETSRLKREGSAPKDLGLVIDRSLIAHLLLYTYFTVLQLLSSHIMIAQRLRRLIAYLRRFVVTSRHGVLACGGFVGLSRPRAWAATAAHESLSLIRIEASETPPHLVFTPTHVAPSLATVISELTSALSLTKRWQRRREGRTGTWSDLNPTGLNRTIESSTLFSTNLRSLSGNSFSCCWLVGVGTGRRGRPSPRHLRTASCSLFPSMRTSNDTTSNDTARR